MRAVAEVEAEHVRPGVEQRADEPPGWSWPARCGDDLGLADDDACSAAGQAASLWLGGDQDRAEVVDVGERRAGDDLIAQRLEEAVAVIVGQALPWRRCPWPRRGRACRA